MTLRTTTLETLAAYAPEDSEQQARRADFLSYVLAHEHAVSRTGTPDHVTASALVVSPDGEQVLLALHARARRWFQTGGHLEDSDPGPGAAAVREAVEESGLVDLALLGGGPVLLDRHPAPCATAGVRDHLDLQYVIVSPGSAQPVASEESLAVRWFPFAALPDGVDDSVRALVRAARARLGRV